MHALNVTRFLTFCFAMPHHVSSQSRTAFERYTNRVITEIILSSTASEEDPDDAFSLVREVSVELHHP